MIFGISERDAGAENCPSLNRSIQCLYAFFGTRLCTEEEYDGFHLHLLVFPFVQLNSRIGVLKLKYWLTVSFFALNFLPWEFLLIKKLEIEKTKTTQYTTFKTDVLKLVLVFLISNFFTNRNSQGKKLSVV